MGLLHPISPAVDLTSRPQHQGGVESDNILLRLAALALENRFEDALEAFLKVVMTDREYREDAGRKALLSLFEVIGMDEPLVIATRRRLAAFLF